MKDARPYRIAIDAEQLYWTTYFEFAGVKTLSRHAAPGTKPTTLCQVGIDFKEAQANEIAVSDRFVYFTSSRPGWYTLFRTPKTAKDVTCEVVALLRGWQPIDLAWSNGRLLVLERKESTTGRVEAYLENETYLDKGATPAVIGAVGDSYLTAMASDGTDVVVYDQSEKKSRLVKLGATNVDLGPGGWNLAFGGGRLYFLDAASIQSRGLSPADKPTRILADVKADHFILVGTTPYWTHKPGDYAREYSLRKAPGTELRTFRSELHGLAGDTKDIYVGDDHDITRVAP